MLSLPRAARNSGIVASAVIALVAVVAGAVRLLPWLLDPAVPWGVAAPFARGLAAVGIEAALLLGWPVGWAIACFRFVESGEARVLLTLGESPSDTVKRLMPQGAVFALVLAAVALLYGSDANAPGRVASELVAEAGASCERARSPATYAVPFTGFTWLCAPDRPPRLVGVAPGLADIGMTARHAMIAGDFRSLALEDANVWIPGATPVAIHAGALEIRGMAPWARASTLPAALRAPLVALTAWTAASLAAYWALRRAASTRLGVLVLGSCGPLTALGLMRLLERASATTSVWPGGVLPFLALPAVAWGSTLLCAVALRSGTRALAARLRRSLRSLATITSRC